MGPPGLHPIPNLSLDRIVMRRIKRLELQVAELQRQIESTSLDINARIYRALHSVEITLNSEGVTRLRQRAQGAN